MADNQNKNDIYVNALSPNTLDDFSSYTYNITFSALPMSFWHTGVLPIGSLAPGKVVIAQTGVTTKFNIDNLQIETVTDTYGSTATAQKGYSTGINFTIVEPLGASLIGLLQVAFNKLKNIDENINKFPSVDKLYTKDGKIKGPLDLPYMIEVELIGYRDAEELGMPLDLDNTQEFERIGTWTWPFYLTQFNFDPKSEGTEYRFQGVTMHNIANKLGIGAKNITKKIRVFGTNVDEMLEDLSTKLTRENEQRLLNTITNPGDTSHHVMICQVGKKYADVLDKEGSEWPEEYKKFNDHHFKRINPQETDVIKDAAYTKNVGEDGLIRVVEQTFEKGTSVKQAIISICKLNAKFGEAVTDRKMEDGEKLYGDEKECNDQIWAPSIRTSCVGQPEGKMSPNGGPAFNITHSIDLKRQIGVTTSSTNNQNEGENDDSNQLKKNAVDQWAITKRYDYMFTGNNDQVLDVDISFPQGQVFLFPAYGGLQPTYKDVPAVAITKKEIEQKEQTVRTRLKTQALNGADFTEALLNKFRELGSDIKDAVSNLGKNTEQVIQAISSKQDLAQGITGSLADGVSPRLPGSPAALYTKSKSILNGTKVIDSLFEDVQDLQQTIEDVAEDVAGGLNIAAGQIAKIIADSANPFEFTSGIGSKLGDLSSGIDGLIDNVNDKISATGLSLSADDIPGLGEAQQFIDGLKDDMDSFTSSGFTAGTGWANNYTFEAIKAGEDPNHQVTFLEELDFGLMDESTNELKFKDTTLHGEAVDPDKKSNDITPQQHMMTTTLSYSDEGIPYLVKLDLTIKGDPYWFGRQNLDSYIASGEQPSIREGDNNIFSPEFSENREDLTSAPYGSGSVLTAFRYIFPKEYNHYSDDFQSHTGVSEIASTDPSYSGYYLVVKVIHSFSQGLFQQELETVKSLKEPNHPLFIVEQAEGTAE